MLPWQIRFPAMTSVCTSLESLPGTTDLSNAVFLEKLTFPRRPAVLSAYSGWSGTHPGLTDRLLDRRTPPPIQITKNTLTAIQMAIAAAT